jgi:hypothetical protein
MSKDPNPSVSPPDVRVIAFYLPQFHPIPENDKWWGAGFTEWTNVARAVPQFRGHIQPNIPADLGFYDLRVAETRSAQADMARKYGIEGFCYWHYWFGGERLLERPFNEVLESGEPNFPFCLGWANHTWSASLWKSGDEREIIKEQTYPGKDDYDRHFAFLLKAFSDPRYIRVGSKPVFVIYRPMEIPDCRAALDHWRELASKNGLSGLHIVGTFDYHQRHWDARANGFDAISIWPLGKVIDEVPPYLRGARLARRLYRRPLSPLRKAVEWLWPANQRVFDYEKVCDLLTVEPTGDLPLYQMAIPNWDTTPRYNKKGIVFHNSSPQAFRRHLRLVMQQTRALPAEQRIVFAKSWNEWAEGNYLEPDLRFGVEYLEVLKEELGLG